MRQLNAGDGKSRLSVFTTSELSFHHLEQAYPRSVGIANILGLFNHGKITEDLFQIRYGQYQAPEHLASDDHNKLKRDHVVEQEYHQSQAPSWMEEFVDESCRWNSTSFRSSLYILCDLFLIKDLSLEKDGGC